MTENKDSVDIESVQAYFKNLQSRICDQMSHCDGSREFTVDNWQYENGSGGGITRTLENGDVIEKGGVNFSRIRGDSLPDSASRTRPRISGKPFL